MKTRQNLKNTVSQIDKLMENIYKLKPELKPKEKSYDRPFNFDIVDSEYGVLVNK